MSGNANPSGLFWQAAGSHDQISPGSVTADTNATALPAQACSQVLVQNDPDSTINILLGNATLQPIDLVPGDTVTLNVTNLNVIYYRTPSGTATLNYLAR